MKDWFRKAGFGLMIHWGLYALPAGEWKGARMKGIGEWLQADFRIPNAEYERLASAFHPIFFDAEEWADIAVCAGMKYMVVTAKHHDGFAMYRSAVDPYNVYDATPFHRDVIGELSHACEKRGLKFGLYYFPGPRLAREKRRRLSFGTYQFYRRKGCGAGQLDERLGLSEQRGEGFHRIFRAEGKGTGDGAFDRLRGDRAYLVRYADDADKRAEHRAI